MCAATCRAWGIHHAAYHISEITSPVVSALAEPLLVAKSALAGVAFGIAGLVFAESNHALGGLLKRRIPHAPLRAFAGGLAIIMLVYLCGTRAYVGLGVWSANPADPTIAGFFAGPIDRWSWALKMLFTVITLSAGFKGGEVTPLFFIGAALGNALAGVLGAPVGVFAGIGFVAVFAGAANTPLACTLMGIELFGGVHAVPIAAACFTAYLCSGHNGIYLSQRVAVAKPGSLLLPGHATLRDVRASRSTARAMPLVSIPPQNPEYIFMSDSHAVTPTEIGMLRIFLKPSDKGARRSGLFRTARPLYRELVLQAKADGILHATAHGSHYGYSNHGAIRESGAEIADPHLSLCVELIAQRDDLDGFCRRHGALLAGKVVVYKHLERWQVDPAGASAA